jgi:serine/threonine protein phosphatase PrpC
VKYQVSGWSWYWVSDSNENGGPDNITVVVVRIGTVSKGWFSWLRRGARSDSGNHTSVGGQ